MLEAPTHARPPHASIVRAIAPLLHVQKLAQGFRRGSIPADLLQQLRHARLVGLRALLQFTPKITSRHLGPALLIQLAHSTPSRLRTSSAYFRRFQYVIRYQAQSPTTSIKSPIASNIALFSCLMDAPSTRPVTAKIPEFCLSTKSKFLRVSLRTVCALHAVTGAAGEEAGYGCLQPACRNVAGQHGLRTSAAARRTAGTAWLPRVTKPKESL